MNPTRRAVLIACLLAAPCAARAGAQSIPTGAGRSLGGYGGAMTETGMGGGGPSIPYAGRFGGFMPYRMGSGGGGGGGGLSFTPRGASMPAIGRTPFGLSPMSGGMGGGMRLMPSAPMSGSGTREMGVMPPSLGYPFRQPPSLLSPASSGSGMSM